MKNKLMIFSIMALMLSSASVWAAEDKKHGAHEHKDVDVKMEKITVNVGNKICPVSGMEIGSMGDSYKVEYQGKQYNLCCKMCSVDFNKNPEKFLIKIQKELMHSKDHKQTHKGSHKDYLNNDGHDH